MTQLEQLKAELESMSRRIAALEDQEEPELKDGDDCWGVKPDGEIRPSQFCEGWGFQFPRTASGKLRAERVGKRFRAMKEPAKEPFAMGEGVWVVNIDRSNCYSRPWASFPFERFLYRLGMVHKTKAEAESWLAENRDAFWGPFGGVE